MVLPTKLPLEREIIIPTNVIRVSDVSAVIEFTCADEKLVGSIDLTDTPVTVDLAPDVRCVTVQQMSRLYDPAPAICITKVTLGDHTYKVYPLN